MGQKFYYSCGNCGYTAEVSGGRDVGMLAVVRTMVCADCEELVDVLIGHHGGDGPLGDPEFDRDLNQCPLCQGSSVTPWARNLPCPNCGEKMKRDEDPSILWD